MPGTLVLRLIGVALVLLVLAGAASAWLVARYVQQDALQQLARQQSDEVDLLARLFAGKIEQVQKQLRGAATRITPQLLAQPAALQRALQQELAAAPWFASMTVARSDGTVLTHLQAHQAGTLRDSGVAASDVAAIGVTNQRETTVLWDRATGEPVANAIVWQDRRTSDYCNNLINQGYEKEIVKKTGLIIDPYFSATKIKWILENVEGAKEKAEKVR